MQKAFTYRKTVLVCVICALVLLTGCGKKEEAPVETPAPTVAPDISLDAEKIIISEVMCKNRATLQDEDGDFSDWIELENVSAEDVSLKGWYLSDDEDEAGWMLPDTVLPAGSKMLIFADGKDRNSAPLHTDFSLSAGETVYLKNTYEYIASSAPCLSDTADFSSILSKSGEYELSLYPTPLFENSAAGYDAWQESLYAAGPLVINEVVSSNFTSIADSELGRCDWVEIKNISDEPVQLSGYYLSDDNDDYRLWQFPEYTLFPSQMLVVFCDDSPQEEGRGSIRAEFSLDSVQEELYLFSEADGLIDFASLRDIPYNCSIGRQPGDNGWFYFENQSPYKENEGGYRRVSAAPAALYADGVFEDVSSVKAAFEAEGKIYYTTDCSIPTESSSEYSGEIEVTETGVVRAIAVEDGAMPSRPTTLSYIINEGHSLPVLSLVSNSSRDFNWMYHGRVKDYETPGSLSLYEQDGSFTIPCGIKMHGETSLILPKKSMSVRFRGAYGQEELNYDAFDGGVSSFTNLVLRGGQDYYSAIIRNELCTNLALATSDALVSQRSKHCVMYIDGKYSGIYTLMEKTNEQHYANLAGVSRDSVTVEEAEVFNYTELFRDVFMLCMENDMSIPENYERFCALMDVDSLIDWIILEGFCANNDLTYGNLRYCRSTENDGKWRLVFYDLDSTFFEAGNNFHNIFAWQWLSSRQVSLIIGPLMNNEDFVDRLMTRAAEYFAGPLSNEAVIAEIDRLAALVRPEVERDYLRHGMTLDKWEWNIQWLKDLIINNDWAKLSENNLCEIFDLTEEERAHYFG